MVRSFSVALIIFSLPTAAWGEPPAAARNDARSLYLLQPTNDHRYAPRGPIGRAEIAPDAHVGFGIFGLKSEKSYLQPVTGREIDAPKQRRAAVGFSLRF